MIFKDEPGKVVDYQGKKIVFDTDGVYKTVKAEEIEFLRNNCFYIMPRKMVEAYNYQQSQKKIVKNIETKKADKKGKDGDNND